MKNSSVLLSATLQEPNRFQAEKVLLPLRLVRLYSYSAHDFIFLQYVECTNLLEPLDERVACDCLRWRADDEQYQTRSSDTAQKMRSLSAVGEQFCVEPLISTCGSVCVVPSKYGIQPVTESLLWTQHSFYMNRFHWDKSLHTALLFATNIGETVHFFTQLVSHFHVWYGSISPIYRVFSTSAYSIFKTSFRKHRHAQRQ